MVYDLETGRRTRVFAGHSSPVVSLVPSPDGRWLASSSLDQTIMLYPLDGCDTRPAIRRHVPAAAGSGAGSSSSVEPSELRRWHGPACRRRDPQGGHRPGTGSPNSIITPETLAGFVGLVNELQARSRYDCRLGPADRLDPLARRLRDRDATDAFDQAEQRGHSRSCWARTRNGSSGLPRVSTTRRSRGIRGYLGWHINADFRLHPPTDFVPIGTYARTHVPAQGAGSALADRGPRSGTGAGGTAAGPSPSAGISGTASPDHLHLGRGRDPPSRSGRRLDGQRSQSATSLENLRRKGPRRSRSRRVIFDERVIELAPLARPQPRSPRTCRSTWSPDARVRLAVEAANAERQQADRNDRPGLHPASRRRRRVPKARTAPDRARRRQRSAQNPSHPAADSHSPTGTPTTWPNFLSAPLSPRDGADDLQNPKEDRIVLTGRRLRPRSINQSWTGWESGSSQAAPKGDIVAVVIAAHVLEFDKTSAIAAATPTRHEKPVPSPDDPGSRHLRAAGRVDRLRLPGRGLPGRRSRRAREGFKSDIKSWVRDLQRERRVITFVASKEGPSGVDVPSTARSFRAGSHAVRSRRLVTAGKVAGTSHTRSKSSATAVRQMVSGPERTPAGGFRLLPAWRRPRQLVRSALTRMPPRTDQTCIAIMARAVVFWRSRISGIDVAEQSGAEETGRTSYAAAGLGEPPEYHRRPVASRPGRGRAPRSAAGSP